MIRNSASCLVCSYRASCPRRRCCSLALGATLILRSLSPPPSTVGSARSIPPSLRSRERWPARSSQLPTLLFQLGTWNLKHGTAFPLPAIVLRRTSCPRRVSVDGHPTRRAFGVLARPKVRGRSCGKTKRPPIAAEVDSVLCSHQSSAGRDESDVYRRVLAADPHAGSSKRPDPLDGCHAGSSKRPDPLDGCPHADAPPSPLIFTVPFDRSRACLLRCRLTAEFLGDYYCDVNRFDFSESRRLSDFRATGIPHLAEYCMFLRGQFPALSPALNIS